MRNFGIFCSVLLCLVVFLCVLNWACGLGNQNELTAERITITQSEIGDMKTMKKEIERKYGKPAKPGEEIEDDGSVWFLYAGKVRNRFTKLFEDFDEAYDKCVKTRSRKEFTKAETAYNSFKKEYAAKKNNVEKNIPKAPCTDEQFDENVKKSLREHKVMAY